MPLSIIPQFVTNERCGRQLPSRFSFVFRTGFANRSEYDLTSFQQLYLQKKSLSFSNLLQKPSSPPVCRRVNARFIRVGTSYDRVGFYYGVVDCRICLFFATLLQMHWPFQLGSAIWTYPKIQTITLHLKTHDTFHHIQVTN